MKGPDAERAALDIIRSWGFLAQRFKAVTGQRGGHWFREETDLFNVFDIHAIKRGDGVLNVQVTTEANVSQHRRKMEQHAEYYPLSDQYRVELWEARSERDPENKRRKRRYFRRHQYRGGTGPEAWQVSGIIIVPRKQDAAAHGAAERRTADLPQVRQAEEG